MLQDLSPTLVAINEEEGQNAIAMCEPHYCNISAGPAGDITAQEKPN